jgi:hypothetical protein
MDPNFSFFYHGRRKAFFFFSLGHLSEAFWVFNFLINKEFEPLQYLHHILCWLLITNAWCFVHIFIMLIVTITLHYVYLSPTVIKYYTKK